LFINARYHFAFNSCRRRKPMWGIQESARFQLLGAMAILDFALFMTSGMTLRWLDVVIPLAATAFLLLGAAYFRHQGRRPILSRSLVAIAQIALFAILAAILNYLLLVFDRPLIDDALLRADEALGIHWLDLFAFLKGGALSDVLTIAYQSNGVLLVGVVALLGFSGREAELDRFLMAFFVATLLTFTFWTVFPSFGAATHLVSIGAVTALPGATVDVGFAKVLLALKSGELKEMFLQDLKGLVAFPSMHTAMALLAVHAVRDIRPVFWPGLVWSALILLSIPVDGGHHVVDVAGGAVLTWLAILASRRIVAQVEERAARGLPVPSSA
jgi:membrane-associated phospholipid phosphatase